jgi:hypothetical protein
MKLAALRLGIGLSILAGPLLLVGTALADDPPRHGDTGEAQGRDGHGGDRDGRNRDDRDDRDYGHEGCPKDDDGARARSVWLEIDSSQAVASVWANGTVSVSLPLENRGKHTAAKVSIAKVESPGGNYVGPSALPYAAGSIEAGDTEPLYAQLSLPSFQPGTQYALTVRGTYHHGGAICHFSAHATLTPPPGNGGQPKSTTTLSVFTVGTAVYPAHPLPHPVDEQPNEEGDAFLPPLGQPRNLFPFPPAESVLDRAAAFRPNDQAPPAGAGSNSVVFIRNQQGGTYFALPPDPNVAGADTSGFVLISANNNNGGAAAAVSYSKNFGGSFTTVPLTAATGFKDPGNSGRTDFFPESDGGLCCDQVVHYIPARNIMVWLLQYWSPSITVNGLTESGQNRLRIAWATPQAAAADFLHAWSWIDITPTTLGDTTATDWFDYPDLAFSNGYLYISVDHGIWNANLNAQGKVIGQQVNTANRWLVRAALDDMTGGKSSVGLIYYQAQKNGVYKTHFVQSAPDAMYYAAEPDTSTLSVFADPDSSPNIPSPTDIAITSRCANVATNPCDYSVNAPDKLNWNVAPHAVLGGTYVAPPQLCPPGDCTTGTRFLYFAFDGGRDTSNNRAYPYVRVEKIDADAFTRVSELDIWNSNFAFATPALVWRPGAYGSDVAFSLATGGGGNYADNAVGFLGDFVAYVTTSSNATQSDSTGTVVRYGDYFAVRNSASPVTQYGQGQGYSTLGYGVSEAVTGSTCAVGGCTVSLQYVLFGRDSELFPAPPPPPPR